MSERGLWTVWVLWLGSCASQPPPADVVFRNGATHREVAIRGERIVALGDHAAVEPYIGRSTRIIDLDGRLLLPGFHDDEVNLLAGARSLEDVWLGDAETHDEILEILRVYATRHPEREVLRGYGWRYHIVEENRRDDLEAVSPEHPIVLISQDGRASWTNRKGTDLDTGSDDGETDPSRAVAYLHRFGVTSIRNVDPLADLEGLEVRVVQGRDANDVTRLAPWSASPDWMPTEGRVFPVQSLLDSGARIVFGSGWPFGTVDPLSGIHAVVTREDLDGRPEGGWQPEERISVEAAVSAYTQGKLEVGALADLVVLSDDLFKIPESRIAEVKVEMTLFDGRIVYTAATFPQ